ncbi:MAG: hypothetical protein JSU94_20645 [Phycisphaerales bacterium]|nr:MAG: hypothetical protein JSU94_20645 [Phycisphaerales bacterium]
MDSTNSVNFNKYSCVFRPYIRLLVAFLIVFLVAGGVANGRIGRVPDKGDDKPGAEAAKGGARLLRLYPAAGAKPAADIRLLPPADKMKDGDACPLYEKAAESLPKGIDWSRIDDWLSRPLEQLPLPDVNSTLLQFDRTLNLLEQAAGYKKADWPWVDVEDMSPTRQNWRQLMFVLALKNRRQLKCRDYARAAQTLQTGFGMAAHLAKGPSPVYGITGVGVSARMCREVELFAQQPGAPGLLAALDSMPRPLIDMTEQLQAEAIDPKDPVGMRIRGLSIRLDQHIAALRCVELVRLHAARRGTLPDSLAQIEGVTIPTDPVTGKQFAYRRERQRAFLTGSIPKGGDANETTRYELTLSPSR